MSLNLIDVAAQWRALDPRHREAARFYLQQQYAKVTGLMREAEEKTPHLAQDAAMERTAYALANQLLLILGEVALNTPALPPAAEPVAPADA